MTQLTIRPSAPGDLEAISACHLDAFGPEEGPEIVGLVSALLQDEAVSPRLSLVAETGQGLVGHVLFTAARVHTTGPEPRAMILAPLAAARPLQKQGVGGRLIRAGLERLTSSGVELVFVLGHPSYYPRHGFRPAGVLGLDAPHPIPEQHADAWMVQALPPADVHAFQGTVECLSILNDGMYWVA